MSSLRWLIVGLALIAPATLSAQLADGDGKADAERAVQAYLAMWSSDKDVNSASVERFYAPHVIYYAKSLSRAQVLKDKLAYVKQWPVRHYTEVPGSFVALCDPQRTRCRVSVEMAWRRVSRTDKVSVGRARLLFEFVPVEGGRKIARESARILWRRGAASGGAWSRRGRSV